ncbi:cytochrome P450 307a1-like isoform X1 [Anastrepha ludens]|uniref:cytochrome P450 307a1-like isoform X1 n=2 Tax=Anastrepha ludens TaxID=28586 RepID=UPI0023B1B092|nr:cytochrome P450 307a1-like isoform X1 [Anastrepha ludens]
MPPMLFSCCLIVIIFGCLYIPILYNHFRKIKVITVESSRRMIQIYQQAPGPFPWPIFGSLGLLASHKVPLQSFTELSKKFGNIYTLTLGSTRCIVVSNLELIREVLNQNGKFFGGRPNFIRYHKLFGGDRNNSLALCDWSLLQKRRRNLARRHCSPRNSSPYFEKMSKIGCSETDILMQQLSEETNGGKPILIKPIIQRTCANMFFRYMCSVRFEHDDREFCKVVEFFDEIFWEINQGYIFDFLPWLAPFYRNYINKITHWSITIRCFIMNRIIKEREQFKNQSEDDFTDALLKSLIEDMNVSRDTIIFMLEDFIGGHSAVGNLVMLTLMYLAKHRNVAKKIQLEADSIATRERRTISFYDIDEMPYTMATIFEVLRCSSSPIVPHVATEDTIISGYGVAKDTIVFINNYNLNHNKLFWKQPQHFQPERFLEQPCKKTGSKQVVSGPSSSAEILTGTSSEKPNESMLNRKNSSLPQIKKNIPFFLPFSIGKRTCIGQNLVRGFGFILIANILRQYDINYEDNATVHIKTGSIALTPKAIPLVLVNRNKIL